MIVIMKFNRAGRRGRGISEVWGGTPTHQYNQFTDNTITFYNSNNNERDYLFHLRLA